MRSRTGGLSFKLCAFDAKKLLGKEVLFRRQHQLMLIDPGEEGAACTEIGKSSGQRRGKNNYGEWRLGTKMEGKEKGANREKVEETGRRKEELESF